MKRYQQIWLAGFLKLQTRRLAVREVFDAVNATGETKNVRLCHCFTSDRVCPGEGHHGA
ncbi:hypothetical protein [Pseudomonas lactis]|uniref:hypothetical protein n=1 Tax=Pseudomonas lactis TaxID=1615674 RepID=UPI001864BAF8|nr:hypothetical protein [Pseudomonas lactis]